METNELVKALQQYSQDLIAFKLDAEFAYAVDQSASAMEIHAGRTRPREGGTGCGGERYFGT